MPRLRTLAAALPLLAPLTLLGACHSPAGGSSPEAASADQGDEKSQEREQRRWKLEQAELDLESAEIGVELDLRQAREALAKSEQELIEARTALEAFRRVEREHELGEAQLGLERQVTRAVEAEMELEELEAMYAEDEFAGKTKELVLERGRRALVLAQRQMELTRMELELLESTKLPKRQRELERAVGEAERAVEKARMELRRTEIDNKSKLREKRHAVEELEREIAKAVEA